MASKTRIRCSIEPSCGKTFSNITSERKHRSQHDHASDFKCGTGCDAHFVTYDAVHKHELTHMPKHKCKEQSCTKEYPSVENLYRHMREKHPAHRCRTCGAGYTSVRWMRNHEAACLVSQSRAGSSNANRVDMSTAAITQPTSPKETIYGNNHVINSVVDWANDFPSPTPAGRLGYRGFLEQLFQPPNAPAEGASNLGIPSYSPSANELNIPLSLPMPQQFPADHDWLNYHHQIQPAEGSRSDHSTSDGTSRYTTGSQSFNPAYPRSGI